MLFNVTINTSACLFYMTNYALLDLQILSVTGGTWMLSFKDSKSAAAMFPWDFVNCDFLLQTEKEHAMEADSLQQAETASRI